MNKNELLRAMESLGISPSKKLGQNFLVDENFLDWLAKEAKPAPGQKILEVGPGFGVLTSRLLDSGAELAAIEFDRKLCAWLKEGLVQKGLRLIEGDACRTDISNIFGKGIQFRFISNLPYSSGSVILAGLLELETPPSDMLIMLQKEMALRLAAQPGSSDYGSLSVRTQASYAVDLLRGVPPQVFHPQPEVESKIVRLTLRPAIAPFNERLLLSQLSRVAFSHRRKKMFKQLIPVFGEEAVSKAFAGASVDMDTRAEKVTVRQFSRMASIISALQQRPEA